MIILAIVLASALGGPAPAGGALASPGQWEKLYETNGKDKWLTALWLKADGAWRAGGKDLIASGDRTGVRVTSIDGFIVYAFGEDASGGVVAVGSRQAIWEERGDGFERVHERAGPPRTGRAAHKDILEGIGYFDLERPSRLVAYGSLHLTVSKEPNQPWRSNEDDDLATRGSLGPGLKSPSGCHPAGWHWLGSKDGVLACHEGMAYLYTGQTPTPLGRLPRPCGTSMPTVVRDGSNLFAACGGKAQIWRHGAGEKAWSPAPGVSDVRALEARGGCLLVATTRAVLRRCSDSPSR